jgi:hypothetical protein
LFEALYLQNVSFKEEWDVSATARFDAVKAHDLQLDFRKEYNEQKYTEMLKGSPVHKLTYKVNPAEMGESSLFEAILKNNKAEHKVSTLFKTVGKLLSDPFR